MTSSNTTAIIAMVYILPFSLELFFPYLRVGIPTIGLLLQFRSHIGGIDRIFQLGADFQIFQSFLHISLLLGYGIQVKEREIPDMNIDSFLASVQIIKSRIKLPVIIIKIPLDSKDTASCLL